jgi:hypothetical protein
MFSLSLSCLPVAVKVARLVGCLAVSVALHRSHASAPLRVVRHSLRDAHGPCPAPLQVHKRTGELTNFGPMKLKDNSEVGGSEGQRWAALVECLAVAAAGPNAVGGVRLLGTGQDRTASRCLQLRCAGQTQLEAQNSSVHPSLPRLPAGSAAQLPSLSPTTRPWLHAVLAGCGAVQPDRPGGALDRGAVPQNPEELVP